MTFFLDFIKQSPSATYLVTTEEFTVEKYGSTDDAQKAAIARYYNLMASALKNNNVNYANCIVRSHTGAIIVSDIQGEYEEKIPNNENEE